MNMLLESGACPEMLETSKALGSTDVVMHLLCCAVFVDAVVPPPFGGIRSVPAHVADVDLRLDRWPAKRRWKDGPRGEGLLDLRPP